MHKCEKSVLRGIVAVDCLCRFHVIRLLQCQQSLTTVPLPVSHQRLEADLSYWMDHSRSNDQGRQHHYDENSPIGPRDHRSYRYGADVNYDYY